MRSPCIAAIVPAVALCIDSTPAQAQGATRAEMEPVVATVCGALGARLREQAQRLPGLRTDPQCQPGQSEAPQGAWRLQVPAVCRGEASYLATGGRVPMTTFRNNAIIENFGTSVRYVFLSQPYTAQEAPFVAKELESRTKTLQREFRDVQVQFTPANGAQALVASIPVNGRLNRDDIIKRLTFFVFQGDFIACDVYTGHERARMANWDRLKGTKLTRLTNDEVVLLNPILQEGNYLVNGSQNYWRLRYDDYSVAIVNSDTVVNLGVGVAIPGSASAAQLARIETEMKAWAADNKFKGATFVPSPETENGRYWMVTNLPYSSLTGRELMDTVKEFYSEFAKDKKGRLKQIIERAMR